MRTIVEFLKLTRPLFLLGGILLYLLGAISAWVATGRAINLQALIIGQLLVTSIQLMTHYSNEYFDLECDRLNNSRTWFSGGSGVLVEGSISPTASLNAAKIFALLSFFFIVLAGTQVRMVIWVGLFALCTAWSYSGPPFFLVRTGWGEICASLVVAGTVPLVGYMMQTNGQWNLLPLLICIPLVLIHFAMLIAFEIPDQFADQSVGKRTLAVRYGLLTAAHIHNGSLLLAFGVILGLWAAHWPGSQLAWLPISIGDMADCHHLSLPFRQRPASLFLADNWRLGFICDDNLLMVSRLDFSLGFHWIRNHAKGINFNS